jgi:hypothetical protein
VCGEGVLSRIKKVFGHVTMKAVRFQDVFDHRILDRHDYEAVGHSDKQLSIQTYRILITDKRKKREEVRDVPLSSGQGVVDSENEEGEDEQDLLQDDVDSEDHEGSVLMDLVNDQ